MPIVPAPSTATPSPFLAAPCRSTPGRSGTNGPHTVSLEEQENLVPQVIGVRRSLLPRDLDPHDPVSFQPYPFLRGDGPQRQEDMHSVPGRGNIRPGRFSVDNPQPVRLLSDRKPLSPIGMREETISPPLLYPHVRLGEIGRHLLHDVPENPDLLLLVDFPGELGRLGDDPGGAAERQASRWSRMADQRVRPHHRSVSDL